MSAVKSHRRIHAPEGLLLEVRDERGLHRLPDLRAARLPVPLDLQLFSVGGGVDFDCVGYGGGVGRMYARTEGRLEPQNTQGSPRHAT